jgi:Heterokaryon incompatibility protein (HET)
MAPYLYRQLSSPGHELRLLTVAPGPRDSDIVCELRHVPLDPKPTYEALSYTWGDTNKRREIQIDGFRVSITVNLEVALRHFRLENKARILWVDAVCINQKDDKEKSEQVQIMREIFNSAHKVLAWTGEASYDSDEAMDLILEFWEFVSLLGHDDGEVLFRLNDWKEYQHGFDPSRKNWAALMRFCERPYWTRIWILQEISFFEDVNVSPWNDRCIVHCGQRSVTRHQCLEVFMALLRIAQWRIVFHEPYLTTWKNQILNGVEMPPAWGMMMLVGAINSASDNDLETRSLLTLMRETAALQATKAQDKIFGLLGLCVNSDRIILPDYTKSSVDIYVSLVKSFIERDCNLYCLLGNRRHVSSSAPSWIPDYIMPLDSGQSWSRTSSKFYKPGGDYECRAHVDTLNRLLTVQGVCVGRVQNLILFPDPNFFPGSKPSQIQTKPGYFLRILSFVFVGLRIVRLAIQHLWVYGQFLRLWWSARSFDENKHELMWRTLVMDIERPMLPVPPPVEDSKFPAPERYRDMYKVWAKVQKLSAKPRESTLSYLERCRQFTHEFTARVFECVINRCIFFTTCGQIGIGVMATRRDDVVCILFGSPLCFILRPCGSRFKLVGEAYVQGVMKGEFLDTDAVQVKDFVLC